MNGVRRVEFCSMLCSDLVFCAALSLAKRVLFIVLFGQDCFAPHCTSHGMFDLTFKCWFDLARHVLFSVFFGEVCFVRCFVRHAVFCSAFCSDELNVWTFV